MLEHDFMANGTMKPSYWSSVKVTGPLPNPLNLHQRTGLNRERCMKYLLICFGIILTMYAAMVFFHNPSPEVKVLNNPPHRQHIQAESSAWRGANQSSNLQNNKQNGSPQVVLKPCSMETREMYLRDKCKENTQKRNSNIGQAFVVDDVNRILYCYTPKIGCSTIKSIMVNISTHGALKPIENYKQLQVLHARVHANYYRGSGLREVNRYTDEMKNFTKFLVVRDPMKRLVSSFYDKMQGKDKIFVKYAYAVTKKYRGINYNALPTFREFIQMVIGGEEISNNPHWNNYFDACDPCHIKYDYVLKLETLDTDLDYFIMHAYGNDARKYSKEIHANSRSVNKTLAEPKTHKPLTEFMDLSSTELSKLKDKFKNEFEFYGYSFDNYVPKCQYSRTQLKYMCC